MFSDTPAVPVLQEIGITNANDKVRFLTNLQRIESFS